MSDTLLEPEDQNARLIGNPNENADWCDDCHGYVHAPWCPAYEEPDTRRSGEMGHRTNHEQPPSTHQPAARGGGETTTQTTKKSPCPACDTTGKCDMCGGTGDLLVEAETVVLTQSQHQSLVAERDRLRDALRIIRDIGWTTYMGTVKNIAQRALATDNQQRSTSE